MTRQRRSLLIRWHGRGGYGAKTAAILLAEAIIEAGGYAQAAPEFGPERRGAPVQAFTRVADRPIAQRGPIERPDVLVVLDRRLLALPSVTTGMGAHTWAVVNAPEAVRVPQVPPERVLTLDASRIARQTVGREIPNIPMLAAIVRRFTWLEPEAFLRWLEHRLTDEFRAEIVAANVQAARMAIEEVADGPQALVAGA